jgi:hypothetical protein
MDLPNNEIFVVFVTRAGVKRYMRRDHFYNFYSGICEWVASLEVVDTPPPDALPITEYANLKGRLTEEQIIFGKDAV